MIRETRDDYLVLIRSEKSREIIERHVPAESLDRITYVMGGLRRPGFGLAPGDADLLKKCDTFWHLARMREISRQWLECKPSEELKILLRLMPGSFSPRMTRCKGSWSLIPCSGTGGSWAITPTSAGSRKPRPTARST